MTGFPFPQNQWLTEQEAIALIDRIAGCRRYEARNRWEDLKRNFRFDWLQNGSNNSLVGRQSVIDALFNQHPDTDAKYAWMAGDLIRHHRQSGHELSVRRAAQITAGLVHPDNAQLAEAMTDRIRKKLSPQKSPKNPPTLTKTA